MHWFIEVLTGHMNAFLLLFILCGAVSFAVDYRTLKMEAAHAKEASFNKAVALAYVIGGAVLLVVLQIINWLLF